uniref:Uncharacterized protein n=1 Tax=Anguilla anguilla TaxID=7936 RepID=A0A0E9R3V9_ANGAN
MIYQGEANRVRKKVGLDPCGRPYFAFMASEKFFIQLNKTRSPCKVRFKPSVCLSPNSKIVLESVR